MTNLDRTRGYPQVLKGWVGEEKGFDPLGVTDALPVYWVREAELKHGRICMLATVGWIAGLVNICQHSG